MSDYDEYFDTIDEGILAQVDELDAAGTTAQSSNISRPAVPTRESSKSVSIATNGEEDTALHDLTLDMSDMDELEEAAAQQLRSRAGPGPSAQRAYMQTKLQGGKLPPQSPQRQPQRRPPFGQKSKKTKVWDQTAFAKTGWKSTKTSKSKKGKGRAGDDENDEECVDLDDVPAPYMPHLYEHIPQSVLNSLLNQPQIKKMKLQPDRLSVREWIFPLNHPKRDYQFNIVRNCLFENCLVAIPTGVGKTFIAGCVMLNYYRWFPEGKIVFVAPTKPLVAQQIEACHQSCGIPGTDAIELTGQIPQAERASYWQTKRVFYMTPQTLVNDLAGERSDPSKIALLVIDEAHRGTGDYAYAQIVRFMMAANPFFRILALTATPGSKPEAVQAIIDSLHISHIEIRNEGSLDVQPYMHKRTTTQHIIEISGELLKIRDMLIKLMRGPLTQLRAGGILWYSDPMQVSPYMCTMKMREVGSNGKWALTPLKTLGAFARILGYFLEFSVGMAYNSLLDLAQEKKKDAKGKPTGLVQSKISQDPNYIALVKEIERQRNDNGSFPVHPKIEKLRMLAIQHFAGAELEEEEKVKPGAGPAVSTTKMIVFCTYRDCVDEIVEMLNTQQPMIRAHRFIGQGTDKRGGKGVTQKAQIGVIKDFKEGKYNVLVSTSIGEEGLDIGEVDIIVCYDSQKAAIRMVQRVGRTGRKKDGKVEVLLAKGREDGNWVSAMGTYKDVQQSIVRGTDLELYGDVERLLPDDVQPQCVEMTMEIIPYEREEPKRGPSDPNSRKTSTKFDGPKGKTDKKRERHPEEEDESSGSPQKKKQRKFVDSDSDSDGVKAKKRARTSKHARSASKPMQEVMKKGVVTQQTGFVSARSLAEDLQGSDEESDAEAKFATKSRVNTGPSKPPKDAAHLKNRESSATKSKATTKQTPIEWLLDSDSESGIKPLDTKLKGTVGVSDIGSSGGSDIEIVETVTTSSKQPPGPSVTPNGGLPVSSPGLPPRRRACAPIANMSLEHSEDVTSPVLRRLQRRNDSNDRARMPPPPLLARATRGPDIPAADSERPGGARSVQYSILDRNEYLEIEAIHSGDEVEAGSSDSEGEANSSDREFLVDTSGTQAPSDYDQSAIYRQGLFTQAPMEDAPRFVSAPVRTGFLGRGRPAVHATYTMASSSPSKDDDLDRYSYGSFVVEDDDDILVEDSSEP